MPVFFIIPATTVRFRCTTPQGTPQDWRVWAGTNAGALAFSTLSLAGTNAGALAFSNDCGALRAAHVGLALSGGFDFFPDLRAGAFGLFFMPMFILMTAVRFHGT